jgi:hypothetical protein
MAMKGYTKANYGYESARSTRDSRATKQRRGLGGVDAYDVLPKEYQHHDAGTWYFHWKYLYPERREI